MPARSICVAVDQEADEIDDVILGAGQQILQSEEIGAHVLRPARDEAQDLRNAPQQRHLAGAARFLLIAAATQALQHGDDAALGAVHLELAESRELDDLAGRHAADHGVAAIAARFEPWQHRLDVVLHEQHGDDDDVGSVDVGAAAFERGAVAAPIGGGVEGEIEPWQIPLEGGARAVGRARKMIVERDDRDSHGRGPSGCNGLSHRIASRR